MYNSIYNTLIIGKKVIYLPTCHSTNDIAAELVQKELAEEGTIVITDNQVNGRGQRGSEWHTEPSKNLTFSIILKPNFVPVNEQFLLSQVVALAIYKYLSAYTNEVKIKWPNDIYVSSKKICGTLIENSIQGMSISNSIVGIGININQVHFRNSRTTSLALVSGREFSLNAELSKFAQFFDSAYLRLRSMQNKDQIQSEYLSNVYGFNETVTFRHQNEIVKGMVTGVSSAGKLRVKLADQKGIYEFGLKEIEWIWED